MNIDLKVMTEKDLQWMCDYTGLSSEHILDWFNKKDQLYFLVEPKLGYARIGVCDREEVNVGIVIRPERVGIGTSVVLELENICKRLGFSRMSWTTKPDNEKSIKFALKHNFSIEMQSSEKVRLIKSI